MRQRHKSRRSETGGVRLHLIESGVIECDGTYQPGRKAYGFRITPPYWTTRRTVCTNQRINRRIWKLQREKETRFIPVHRWLCEHLLTLEFDAEQARRVISRLTPRPETNLTIAEYQSLITESCRRLTLPTDRQPNRKTPQFLQTTPPKLGT